MRYNNFIDFQSELRSKLLRSCRTFSVVVLQRTPITRYIFALTTLNDVISDHHQPDPSMIVEKEPSSTNVQILGPQTETVYRRNKAAFTPDSTPQRNARQRTALRGTARRRVLYAYANVK